MSTPGGDTSRRKLIEVAIPLDVINKHSIRDKALRHGHPSTFHTWWARRPLPTCRAVVFASLVDDPGSLIDEFPTVEEQENERERLFRLMAKLMVWENVDQLTPEGKSTIHEARAEIAKSLARSRRETAPTKPEAVLKYLSDEATGIAVFDPFAGGGSIPLESQRLGLRSNASDLNPVAVLINRAMVEMPVKFQNQPPASEGTNPGRSPDAARTAKASWRGYSGIAHDIRHYAKWVNGQVRQQIGGLYPQVSLPNGSHATVMAWLWANTVPCSNPACEFEMPLLKTFQLSKKRGKVRFARPTIDREHKQVRFSISSDGSGFDNGPTVDGKSATCLACGTSAALNHVRDQTKRGRMGQQLMAIVGEGPSGRVFLDPDPDHASIAKSANANWRPTGNLPARARSISIQTYGITEWHQLFTERQLHSLGTFVKVLGKVKNSIIDDGASEPYAELITTYLGLAFGRLVNFSSRFSRWNAWTESVAGVFGRQSIGMIWDFPELNPFSNFAGNWIAQSEWVAKAVNRLPLDVMPGRAFQADAAATSRVELGPVVVTDPPYYDNIGYADISDFFYVWLRAVLGSLHPELFIGIQTPKDDEIVAGPMFKNTGQRFERLLQVALGRLRDVCSPEYPASVFYAYKQKKATGNGVASSGWEKFLSALINAQFQVISTWPVRTEFLGKLVAAKAGLLATSVVVVVRPRDPNAPVATRRQFIDELEMTLPGAISRLIGNGIGPVDLEQAAIGPGMEVFTKYSRVETIAGEPVSVGEALVEVNRVLDDFYRGEEGHLDPSTRFCRSWLDHHDFDAAPFGDALTLATARGVVIGDLQSDPALVFAQGGILRLLTPIEIALDDSRSPLSHNTTAWEGCMRMVYHMEDGEDRRGIEGAAEIANALGIEKADQVRRLAGILFNHYDRKFQPRNSRVYNDIVNHWPDIMQAARDESRTQTSFAA